MERERKGTEFSTFYTEHQEVGGRETEEEETVEATREKGERGRERREKAYL